MKIVEIFESIQGEGLYLGTPVIFLRLAGCNLHCPFCDTKESWGTQEADESITNIVRRITMQATHTNTVVITGGEPLMNDELSLLIRQLHENGFRVNIETNGSYDYVCHPEGSYPDWTTCSPKEESGFAICNTANELKYVVTPDFDASVIKESLRERFAGKIWLQPEGAQMRDMWKKCTEIAMSDPRLRVGVQLHKIMEVR